MPSTRGVPSKGHSTRSTRSSTKSDKTPVSQNKIGKRKLDQGDKKDKVVDGKRSKVQDSKRKDDKDRNNHSDDESVSSKDSKSTKKTPKTKNCSINIAKIKTGNDSEKAKENHTKVSQKSKKNQTESEEEETSTSEGNDVILLEEKKVDSSKNKRTKEKRSLSEVQLLTDSWQSKKDGILEMVHDGMQGSTRSRGCKQKAIEKMSNAPPDIIDFLDLSDSSVTDVSDSENETNGDSGVIQFDSDEDQEVSFKVINDKEVDNDIQEIESDSESEVEALKGDTLEKAKEDFYDLLQEKHDEIKRLRNELKWKTEQLGEMNELVERNMELEARINHMLDDKEVYEKEVKKRTEERENRNKTKDSRKEDIQILEKKTKKKVTKNGDKVEIDLEVPEASTKSKTRRKSSRNSPDSDIEILEHSEEDEKKTRKRRRGNKKEDEESEEQIIIDSLFVEDDSEPEEAEEKKKRKKGTVAEKENENGEKEKKEDENTGDEDDDEDEDSPKGRKDIRKLMSDKKLKSETKTAAKIEKERRDRIKKLHELHLIEIDKDPKHKTPVCTKLVLEMAPDTKKPLVEVNKKLVKKLKPHQVEAVEFLWDSTIESLERIDNKKDDGSGCILAHCMGLGKTLSVISFVHTLMVSKTVGYKTCLVVCPLNTVLNWQYEWQKWFDKKDRLKVYELAGAKDNHNRARLLQKWQKEGGIMIMGYQLFRILANSTTKSKKKKQIFTESLIDPGPNVVICDEGHVLKNDQSAISKCMNRIKTKRRIVLTGTPLQNNLVEYHCMVSFVKPSLLGTSREFRNRFVNPITNGQHSDSTARDVKLMQKRAHVLHEMLSGCVQRRDYSALTKFLPPKHEYIIAVRLSKLQIDLYQKYMDENTVKNEAGNFVSKGAYLFTDYQNLMRIWTHPWVLKLDEIRQEKKMENVFESESEEESIIEEEEENESTENSSSQTSEEEEEEEEKTTASEQSSEEEETPSQNGSNKRSTRSSKQRGKEKSQEKDSNDESKKQSAAEKVNGDQRKAKVKAGEVINKWKSSTRGGVPYVDVENGQPKEQKVTWWSPLVKEDDELKIEYSGKLILLFEILRMSEGLGDKVLLFSQSLLSLDLIEMYLAHKNQQAEEHNTKAKGKNNKMSMWVKGEDYCRIDGSSSALSRSNKTSDFNDQKNKRLRLFLISTRAGGLGINLDSANRVIIFDASWNPSHDVQSIFRAYRFGQEKSVFVYRFLAQGTMEEKIYERQVAKEALSQRVIDEHQIDRHFSDSDLQELYVFKPERLDDPDKPERPVPPVPKDIILAELMSSHKDWIVSYHEHDSLLENRPDENLSEEERLAAWEEFEKDKQAVSNMGTYASYRVPNPSVYGYRPMTSASVFSGAAIQGPAGSTTDARYQFQMQQLPRVVQEILKYNPNISPSELQTRLHAFLGMHSKYNIPNFNVTHSGQTVPITASQPGTAQQPSVSIKLVPSSSQQQDPAETGAMPSRLPQPGKLPAGGR